jgi:hypothetical protein
MWLNGITSSARSYQLQASHVNSSVYMTMYWIDSVCNILLVSIGILPVKRARGQKFKDNVY